MAAIPPEFCQVNFTNIKYFPQISKTKCCCRTSHDSGTLQEDIDILCDPVYALLTSSLPSNFIFDLISLKLESNPDIKGLGATVKKLTIRETLFWWWPGQSVSQSQFFKLASNWSAVWINQSDITVRAGEVKWLESCYLVWCPARPETVHLHRI